MLLEIIGMGIVVFAISLIFHEIGHYAFARFGLKQKVKLYYSKVIIYPDRELSKKERIHFMLAGIFAGLVPIALSVTLIQDSFASSVYFITIVVFYVVGCVPDIKRINYLGNESLKALYKRNDFDKDLGV